ncbi:MAG TPA: FAD-dependent monooxygenase [Streptosporangiaceae bacterium]|nr:FAD-dependent monooxygenase [Streptosporangiaceae bacterium]
MADTTVLIAGAGPAGLAAAAELGFHGIDCIAVEPRTEVSHRRPRAKTTSARTMEHFRRWGIAGKLRAAAPLPVAWSQRVTFCESLTGRRITDFDHAFALYTEPDERFAEPGQQVPQPVVEDVLREHVSALPAARLRLGDRVESLEQDADGVTTKVGRPDGTAYQIRSSYVLGCDGASGVVRDQVGAVYEGHADPRPNFNFVFRARDLDTHLGPSVQYWVLGKNIAGLVGRLDLNGTWWAIMSGIDEQYGNAHASELLRGLIGRPFEHEILATDPWTARMMIADRFSSGRVFLVGESAHLNPPWGGHGFNTSVGDAVNIGWKIAAVERGWAPPALLASYDRERRGVAEQTIAVAAANMKALARSLPTDAESIQRAKYAEFHSLGLVLGYSYAGSPVIQPGPAPATDTTAYTPVTDPGARLPHHWLADGSSLYDHLGPGFTLLGPRRDRGLGAPPDLPLKIMEGPPDYPWRDEYLLVRPDQHIAWRATEPEQIDFGLVAGEKLASS